MNDHLFAAKYISISDTIHRLFSPLYHQELDQADHPQTCCLLLADHTATFQGGFFISQSHRAI